MLLAAGADPNVNGTREVGEAPYHACEFPDPACAALLIDAGTDAGVVDYCLGRALNFPYPEVAEMFCSHGAHASAEHLMQSGWRRRAARTVRALLDAGAPATARLLDAGAHGYGPPGGKEVPLGHAAWRGYPRLGLADGHAGCRARVRRRRQRHRRRPARFTALQPPRGRPDHADRREIPQPPYAEIVRTLLDAGARVPDRLGWDVALAPDEVISQLFAP